METTNRHIIDKLLKSKEKNLSWEQRKVVYYIKGDKCINEMQGLKENNKVQTAKEG